MHKSRTSVIVLRGLIATAVMFVAWLPHYGGTWLVHHDSVYYRLGDAGYRWLTDTAEICFALGPIPFLVVGLVIGVCLAVALPIRRWTQTVT